MADSHDWVLILAGGRGRRLQHLTGTASGVLVPKQFCSLGRGPSLFHAMRGQLDLAERIKSRESAWESSASSLRSYP